MYKNIISSTSLDRLLNGHIYCVGRINNIKFTTNNEKVTRKAILKTYSALSTVALDIFLDRDGWDGILVVWNQYILLCSTRGSPGLTPVRIWSQNDHQPTVLRWTQTGNECNTYAGVETSFLRDVDFVAFVAGNLSSPLWYDIHWLKLPYTPQTCNLLGIRHDGATTRCTTLGRNTIRQVIRQWKWLHYPPVLAATRWRGAGMSVTIWQQSTEQRGMGLRGMGLRYLKWWVSQLYRL